ncbi:hypothetical protein HN588_04930 [Candidatus Bathyarchaeota archaeon]|nr:hypothetical protein [Candidatus Bathyarchaeota archaeon]
MSENLANEKEVEEFLAECDHSFKYFCKSFFPAVFYKEFSPDLHDPIFEILDDDSIQTAAIAAPRGIGKTTLVNTIFPIKRMIFQDSHYIIPVSATSDSAVEQSEDIKTQLIESEDIAALFGNFEPEERKDSFGRKEWVTAKGTKVMPRGAGQQVRGRKFRSRRPDLILVDDLEDDEGVESEERREKLKKWFFSALLNSVERGRRDWRVIVVGTILHEDSLLNNLLDESMYPDWKTVRLELFDDNYKSIWPEHMTDEDVKKLANSYRRNEMLDVLYREFRNIPVAKENAGFKQDYFQEYEESELNLNGNSDVESVVLMDPARTMKTGSANTAIVGVGVNTRTNEIFVREIIEDQMYPDTLYNETFAMAERLNALVIAPEVTGLHEYITYPLRNEMLRLGKFYVIVEVSPREGKSGPRRSGGMVPMYRNKLVKHSSACSGIIEKYLLQWPRPSKWDVIDALSGIIYVLEEGDRYFEPRETGEDIESEYAELEEDDDPALEYERVI